jgi:TolA-binding protein
MKKSTQEEIDNHEEFKESIEELNSQIRKLNGKLSNLSIERMRLLRNRYKQ